MMNGVLVVADLEVRVSTSVPEMLPRLEAIFGAPSERPVSRSMSLVIGREPEGTLEVTFDGEETIGELADGDIIPTIEGLIYQAVTETPGRAALHAGCVTRGGHTLLFVGPSNSGKSSLCRAALGRGWRYASDDLTLFDGRRLLGLSRSIAFDVIDVAKETPAWVRDADVSTYQTYVGDKNIAVPLVSVAPTHRVDDWIDGQGAHVVIPERVQTRTSLAPLPATDALAALLAGAHHPDPPDLGVLTRREAYRLSWVSPDEGIHAIERALGLD